MESVKGVRVPERVAFYVDGFNLYHAVNDLGINYLKWNNLRALAQGLIQSRSQELVRVVFCTAFYPGDTGKRARHERYIKAQKHFGVDVVLGHYVREDMECRDCGHAWKKPTEKETDINVALAVIDDAHMGIFDHALLVTNDSDQAATAKLFAQRFPTKKLTTVCPPGRSHSKHLLDLTSGSVTLTRDHLEKSVMDHMIHATGGLIVRPHEYAPPTDWVHPRDRPK
jgi:hypothetical protein